MQGNREMKFSGISTDSRTIKKGELFIALEGQNFDGHNFITEAFHKGARGAVVAKKTLFREDPEFAIILVKDALGALRAISRFHRQRFNLPIIAITGSNGKTTTKEMVYDVLSSSYRVLKTASNHNNQIGASLALLNLDPSYDLAVLELGINHFGEMEVLRDLTQPSIALFTNISSTHLEFLDTPEDVLKAKLELVKDFTAESKVIINADDDLLRRGFLETKRNFSVLSFGIEQKADFQAEILNIDNRGLSFKVNESSFFLPVLGRQNIYNALAGIAMGNLFGVSSEKIILALRDFRLPRGRMNIEECDGFILIDDAYNANPESVRYAVETLANFKTAERKILVLGDMLELGKYSEICHRRLGNSLSQIKIDILITVGKCAAKVSEQVIGFKGREQVKHFSSNREAAVFLNDIVKTGDVVLIKGSRAMHMEEILVGLRQYRKDTATLAKY